MMWGFNTPRKSPLVVQEVFVYMYIGLAIKQVKNSMGIPPSRDGSGSSVRTPLR